MTPEEKKAANMARVRKWAAENKDKVSENKKRYYLANMEKVKASALR